MTFEDFYAERLAAGLTDTAANRTLCQAAWDTALCAASAACLDKGKIREGRECLDAISKLHTWATQQPSSSPC